MSKLNTATKPIEFTHEGAPAKRISPLAALRRSVCSCLLWEDEFYEDGQTIADRIVELAAKVKVNDLAMVAHEVRAYYNLRHVPLLLLAVLAKRGSGNSVVRETITKTISRADEMGEFLAIYARMVGVDTGEIKSVLPAQVKKGLAAAFGKFDAYQLAKYNRKGSFTLKDIMRLTHPKPQDERQSVMWKKLLDDSLETPDTWETNLSAGKDKKETFTRLLNERKLGYLALLRNLRGMVDAGVDTGQIIEAILARKGARRVLPVQVHRGGACVSSA